MFWSCVQKVLPGALKPVLASAAAMRPRFRASGPSITEKRQSVVARCVLVKALVALNWRQVPPAVSDWKLRPPS